jgi:hypothetical protein
LRAFPHDLAYTDTHSVGRKDRPRGDCVHRCSPLPQEPTLLRVRRGRIGGHSTHQIVINNGRLSESQAVSATNLVPRHSALCELPKASGFGNEHKRGGLDRSAVPQSSTGRTLKKKRLTILAGSSKTPQKGHGDRGRSKTQRERAARAKESSRNRLRGQEWARRRP